MKVCVLIWIYISLEGYVKTDNVGLLVGSKLNELCSPGVGLLKIKRLKFHLYYESRRYLAIKALYISKKNEHLNWIPN